MTATKKRECEARTIILKGLCNKHGVTLAEFNKNSFRLNKKGKIIDYYPQSNKCFWHSNHEWGAVDNLESFLKFEYGN